MVVVVRASVMPRLRNVNSTAIVSGACSFSIVFASEAIIVDAPGGTEPTSDMRIPPSFHSAVQTD